jgi:hypothetical protein
MRAGVLALVVACGAPPHKAAPPPPKPPPPTITGGRVDTGSWRISYLMSLGFAGGRLLVGNAGALGIIDPATRKLETTISLSSRMIPDPNGRPGAGDMLAWNVDAAIWAWDPGATLLYGAVSLSARGDATSGLAIWTPAAGAPRPIAAPEGLTLCQPLAWSADRSQIAVRVAMKPNVVCDSDAQSLEVFDVATGAPVTRAFDAGYANVAAFSRDGRYVAGGSDGLRVYDIRERAVVERIRARGVRSIAFHPTEPIVAWTDEAGAIHGWHLAGRRKVFDIGKGDAIAFSPDGRYLAVATPNEVALLDAKTYERLGSPMRDIRAMPAPIYIAWSDDSRQLAVALSGTDVGMWRIGDDAASRGDSAWFAQLQPLPIPPSRPPPAFTRDGDIEGTVVSAGKPVANAEVKLVPHWQEYADARALPPIVARTDRDGRFHLAEVPTIQWQATVDAVGCVLGGSIFDLRTKDKTQHVSYDLEPAVTIAATLADKRDVRITHYSYDGSLDLDVTAKGSFVIDHIRPVQSGGKYEFTIQRADGAVRTAVVDVTNPGRQKLTLSLLPPTDPHVLRVVVVDAKKAPVANAAVIVNESHSVPTDADGHASFEAAADLTKGIPVRVRAPPRFSEDHVYVDLPQVQPATIIVK